MRQAGIVRVPEISNPERKSSSVAAAGFKKLDEPKLNLGTQKAEPHNACNRFDGWVVS